jgi:hypothetical protein
MFQPVEWIAETVVIFQPAANAKIPRGLWRKLRWAEEVIGAANAGEKEARGLEANPWEPSS